MDYTYLNQLNLQDLLDRARMATGMTTSAAQLVRALADRLEEYSDLHATINSLEAELGDAERRAEGWREEAQALQRQIDRARG